jgi:hypothetical protein
MKNIKMLYIIIILTPGFLIFCNHPKNIGDLIQENDTKQVIRQQIGEPVDITIIEKTTEIIWGPEEAFWSQINLGEQVEVWSYELGQAQLKLYFRENSDSLFYKTVVDPEAVYESEVQEQ